MNFNKDYYRHNQYTAAIWSMRQLAGRPVTSNPQPPLGEDPDPGLDVDCILGSDDYTALVDVLQTLGVDVLQAVHYVCSMRKAPSDHAC